MFLSRDVNWLCRTLLNINLKRASDVDGDGVGCGDSFTLACFKSKQTTILTLKRASMDRYFVFDDEPFPCLFFD